MTTSAPVKQTNTNPANHGGDDYDNGYDPNMDGPEGPGQGDGFTQGDGSPVTVEGLRKEIKSVNDELTHNKDLKPADRRKLIVKLNTLNGQVSAAMALKGERRAAKLGQIEQDLGDIESQIAGDPSVDSPDGGGDPADPTADHTQLKKDLQKAIDDIDSRTNLTSDEKVSLKAPLEKDLTDIGLAEKDPSKLDVDKINTDLEEAKTKTNEQDAYSPGLKGLAEVTGLSPEEIKGKAQAKGLNLANIPNPPTKELLDFLVEIVPDLKDKIKKVEDAINERTKFIESESHAQSAQDQANCSSTTDTDNTDLSHIQNLYNLKHHQDDKSKAVMDAMHEVVGALTPLFKALYPGQDVKAVETSGTSGWQKTDQEYKVADQISIGGTTLDLFNNTDGKLQASTSPDKEPDIGIPGIHYDGEGDGQWAPQLGNLQTYGSAAPNTANYDPDAGGGSGIDPTSIF